MHHSARCCDLVGYSSGLVLILRDPHAEHFMCLAIEGTGVVAGSGTDAGQTFLSRPQSQQYTQSSLSSRTRSPSVTSGPGMALRIIHCSPQRDGQSLSPWLALPGATAYRATRHAPVLREHRSTPSHSRCSTRRRLGCQAQGYVVAALRLHIEAVEARFFQLGLPLRPENVPRRQSIGAGRISGSIHRYRQGLICQCGHGAIPHVDCLLGPKLTTGDHKAVVAILDRLGRCTLKGDLLRANSARRRTPRQLREALRTRGPGPSAPIVRPALSRELILSPRRTRRRSRR